MAARGPPPFDPNRRRNLSSTCRTASQSTGSTSAVSSRRGSQDGNSILNRSPRPDQHGDQSMSNAPKSRMNEFASKCQPRISGGAAIPSQSTDNRDTQPFQFMQRRRTACRTRDGKTPKPLPARGRQAGTAPGRCAGVSPSNRPQTLISWCRAGSQSRRAR
jgi:hypothetical protein